MKKIKKINRTFKKQKSRRLSLFKKYKGGNKKNVALIFYGRVSSYELSIEYLNSVFRNPTFNCKVFCSLNLTKINNYIKEFCSTFEIGDEQLNIESTVLPQSYIDMNKELCKDPTYSCYSSYSSFYHQNKAFNLVEQYKNKNNINFEVVIVLRADLNPSNNAPKVFLINDNIKPNTVYIPRINNRDTTINNSKPASDFYSDGITTLSAYGNFDTMKKYCNLINNITSVKPIEVMLLDHIKKMNINIERYGHELIMNPERKNSKYNLS